MKIINNTDKPEDISWRGRDSMRLASMGTTNGTSYFVDMRYLTYCTAEVEYYIQ